MTTPQRKRPVVPPVVLNPVGAKSDAGPMIRPAKYPEGGWCLDHNAVGHDVHWEWLDRKAKKGRTRPCMRHTGYCAACLGDVDASREPRRAFWLTVLTKTQNAMRVVEFSLHAVHRDERLDPDWKGDLRSLWLYAAKEGGRKNAPVYIDLAPGERDERELPLPFDRLGWLVRLWDVGTRYDLLPNVSDSAHLLRPYEEVDPSEVPNPPPDLVDGPAAG